MHSSSQPNDPFQDLLVRIQENKIREIDFEELGINLSPEQVMQLASVLRTNKSVIAIIFPPQFFASETEEDEGKGKEKENSNDEIKILPPALWESVLEYVERNKLNESHFDMLLFRIRHRAIEELDRSKLDFTVEQLKELAVVVSETNAIKAVLPNHSTLTTRQENEYKYEAIWRMIEMYVKLNQLKLEIAEIERANAENDKNHNKNAWIYSIKESFIMTGLICLIILDFGSKLVANLLSYLTLIKPLYLLSNWIFGTKDTVKLPDFTFFDENDRKPKIIETEYKVNSFTRYLAPICHSASLLGKGVGTLAFSGLLVFWVVFLLPPFFVSWVLLNRHNAPSFSQATHEKMRAYYKLDKKIIDKRRMVALWKADYYLKLAYQALDKENPKQAEKYLQRYEDNAAMVVGNEINREKVMRDYWQSRQELFYSLANQAFAKQSYKDALLYFTKAKKAAEESGDESGKNDHKRMCDVIQGKLAGEEVLPGFQKDEPQISFDSYKGVLVQQGAISATDPKRYPLFIANIGGKKPPSSAVSHDNEEKPRNNSSLNT